MEPVGLVSRLWLAFVLPWRLLFDGVFAAKVKAIDAPPAIAPPPPPVVPEQKAEIVRDEPDHTAALQLLALLQREGRLVDFLREDMAGFSDADIGAAARVVHQGCARALAQHIELEPIRSESEGAAIELPVGYDAAKVRVTGNVAGEPPYRGTLAHHGWRAKAVRLPTLSTGHDARIVAPAEVEVTRA